VSPPLHASCEQSTTVAGRKPAMMPIRMESDMVKLASLDDNISIIDQLGENKSPVVLVNVFTVDPKKYP
jgi:hypothetical protein